MFYLYLSGLPGAWFLETAFLSSLSLPTPPCLSKQQGSFSFLPRQDFFNSSSASSPRNTHFSPCLQEDRETTKETYNIQGQCRGPFLEDGRLHKQPPKRKRKINGQKRKKVFRREFLLMRFLLFLPFSLCEFFIVFSHSIALC